MDGYIGRTGKSFCHESWQPMTLAGLCCAGIESRRTASSPIFQTLIQMSTSTQSPQGGEHTSKHQPAYVRLPKAGEKCVVSGLCRTTLFELTSGSSPKVRSKILKQPGASRGIRLIEVASLLAYIDSLPESVESINEKGGTNV